MRCLCHSQQMDRALRRFLPVCHMLGFVLLCLVCVNAPASSEQFSTSPEPYHVGVWFYPSWNHTALGTWGPQHWIATYGRADIWGGVRDFVENRGAFTVKNPLTGDPIVYSNRKPLIGFYDLMEQPVVDAEIQMAAHEGIEFFSFYWYIDSATGKEQAISAPTKLFFSSSERGKLKFVLAPIIGADQPKGVISLETWQRTVVPALISYMASGSSYSPGGRPLVVDFAWRFASAADYKEAVMSLRRESLRRLGVTPLIISLMSSRSAYNDLHYGWKVIGVDGFTCFQPPIVGSPEPYKQYVGEAIPWMKATMSPPKAAPSADLLYMPCGAIGRDPHPWQTSGTVHDLHWTVGTSRSLWREHLRQIRSFMDLGYVNTMKTLFLYAWNEWGESAAQIEPSQKQGYAFADTIREVFDLRSRSLEPAKPP